MVKYWVHSGILMINGEKMSKSLGNFITGKKMIDQHSADDFRFMVVSAHYRSLMDYTGKLMIQAHSTLASIRAFAQELKAAKSKTGTALDVEPYAKRFFAALDDDLNTPAALAVIFILMRDARAKEPLSALSARSILAFLKAAEQIFGVAFTKTVKQIIPQNVTEQAQLRETLRKAGKWAEADAMRDKIAAAGYAVKDIPGGFEIIPVTK